MNPQSREERLGFLKIALYQLERAAMTGSAEKIYVNEARALLSELQRKDEALKKIRDFDCGDYCGVFANEALEGKEC